MERLQREVDELIEAVNRKLKAKRSILEESVHHGSIVWRRDRKGRLTITIKPEIT